MAAQIYNEEDLDKSVELTEDEELQNLEEQLEESTGNPEVELEEEVVEDNVPEKYKGKSTDDIIKMHQEVEKLVGRQGSEVGELRKIVDDFVKANLTAPQKESVEEEVDFYDNPSEAVKQAIANNPDLQDVRNLKKELQETKVTQLLEKSYPDYIETVNSEPFVKWIQDSKVRSELFNKAHTQLDWDAANELLGTWKTLNQASAKAKELSSVDLKQQRKAASTGSAKGTGESSSKKVYRRIDIINLMQNNPTRYLDLADEITQAYQEGRVR
jgi:hypothetical protein